MEYRLNNWHHIPLDKRRLSRAVEHVNTFWLPIETSTHYQVLRLLDEPESSEISVRDEVKKDPYLYLYILRELSAKKICFHRASKTQLNVILEKNISQISTHNGERGAHFQIILRKQLQLELATLTTLSEAALIDSNTSYEAGALNQLGINLICWNYPQMYQEAISEARPSFSIEKILTRKLGFSPLELAKAVVDEWEIGDFSRALINPHYLPLKITEEFEVFTETVKNLKKICDISTAFSRAHHPEMYASAKRDFRNSYQEIYRSLGSEGIDKIQKQYYSLIGEVAPILSSDSLYSQHPQIASFEPPRKVYQLNRELKTKFFEFYEEINHVSVHSSLKKITKDILSSSQFDGLELLTFDPVTRALSSQFSTGELFYREQELYDSENSKPLQAFLNPDQIVLTAVTPEEFGLIERTALFTCLIINDRTIGVLHVEGPFLIHDILSGQHRDELVSVKLALEDALHLA